ncbi:MAG: hypothetical protein FWD30_01460 [Dehalococcoidia bacterium]|nr:hypothetical protein [Dehalococcoidia bacterium]
MTLNSRRNKFALPKKVFAFLGIVPLVLLSAWVPTTCPGCHGRGEISSYGMDNVTVIDVYMTGRENLGTIVCGSLQDYHINVTILLKNTGTQDARGQVIFTITDELTGNSVDQYFPVSIDAGKVGECVAYGEWAVPVDDIHMSRPLFSATVANDHNTCKVCGGTGKVSLNTWPLYNATSERINVPFWNWQNDYEPPPLVFEVEGGYYIIVLDPETGEPLINPITNDIIMEYVYPDGFDVEEYKKSLGYY